LIDYKLNLTHVCMLTQGTSKLASSQDTRHDVLGNQTVGHTQAKCRLLFEDNNCCKDARAVTVTDEQRLPGTRLVYVFVYHILTEQLNQRRIHEAL